MRHSVALIATSSLWAAAACSDGGTGVTAVTRLTVIKIK
jgi:hypothetical protein